ncbi:MAG: FAD-dependent oxidoreductase [Desulfovibrio sp.]
MAVILGVASRILHVEEDPRVAEVESYLPGANCGGCGYPGCNAAAVAVVKGEARPELCVAAGMDVAQNIASVMGCEVGFKEPRLASMICTGGSRASRLYSYEGIRDCRAEAQHYGGDKSCGLGCIGLGSCVKACKFGALRLDGDGLPIVNLQLCRACGKCAEVCPTGAIRISGMTEELLHINTSDDCLAPCMQKCPAQVDVRTFIQHIKRGEMREALLTIKKRLPIPLIIGRICPHPCQAICRRNIVDEGVAICQLMRFVADWEMQSGTRIHVPCNPRSGKRVAIIGGGPAGLSAAYFLRRIGHQPVIYEARSKLGGMVAQAIPAYRVPTKVSNWEIQGILEMGVEAITGMKMGRDFSMMSLRDEGFDAIFLATGAWKTPPLNIDGDDAAGIFSGIEFLRQVLKFYPDLSGKRIVVIGDSNTAMDVVCSAARLKADKITVISPHIKRKMSASNRDIESAEALGAIMKYNTRPTAVVKDDEGRGVQVVYESLRYKNHEKATGPLQPVEDSKEFLPFDMLINATDRMPMLAELENQLVEGEKLKSKKDLLDVDPITMQTNVPWVFAGGEITAGRSAAIQAVADGRRAARAIHYYITNDGEIPFPEGMQCRVIPESILKNMSVNYHIPKVHTPEIPFEERSHSFKEEFTGKLSSREARKESARCLRCGLTCYDADAGKEYAADPDVTRIEN